VERAKGLLQQKFGISEEDAYFRLRNQSRRLRRPMRALAEAIILSEDLDRDSSASSRDERVA
jgi:AmiR/NasT family two-component response regulator